MGICLIMDAQNQDKDLAQLARYEQANDTIKVRPRALFMGDLITDGWAKKEKIKYVD